MSEENVQPEINVEVEPVIEEVTESPTEEQKETKEEEDNKEEDSGELSFEEWKLKDNQKKEKANEELEKVANKNKEEREEKTKPSDDFEIEYKVGKDKHKATMKDIPALLSKAHGADKAYEQASNLRNEAVEFVNWFKKNPLDAMKKAGIDWTTLAIDHVHEQMKLEDMLPEERLAYENAKELETYKLKDKKQKEEQDQDIERQRQKTYHEKEQKATQEAKVFYETQISQALETASLPVNTFTKQRSAIYLKSAYEQGYDLEATDVMHLVSKEWNNLRENERKNEVKKFKAEEKQKRKETKKATDKPKNPKKIRSIYDLLE